MKRNEIRQTVRYNYYVCYLLIKLFCLEKDRKLIMRARANESNSSLNSGKPTDVRYGWYEAPKVFSVMANFHGENIQMIL